jgi:tRNA G18 (ribose-2'-O)-methylase SpoU
MFTSKKFEKLELKQQHKKCAYLLRFLYEKILNNETDYFEIIDIYKKYLKWMHLSDFSLSCDLKKLSDQYHFHLKNANIHLKEHNLLPNIRRKDRDPSLDFPNIAIYLDNIRSAYNVGSILRTTEALRAGMLYFKEKTPFIDNNKVIKTSMGASEIVPCYNNFSIKDLPKPFIALETAEDAIAVSDFIFPKNFTLILGNEEFGISDDLLNKADYFIDIPLYGKKNSINVACAFSIAAAEIRRQHIKTK